NGLWVPTNCHARMGISLERWFRERRVRAPSSFKARLAEAVSGESSPRAEYSDEWNIPGGGRSIPKAICEHLGCRDQRCRAASVIVSQWARSASDAQWGVGIGLHDAVLWAVVDESPQDEVPLLQRP